MAHWIIQTTEITGGFLAGLNISFPPGLTCVIGPRGSGKSTLAEAIRFAILGTSGNTESRTALVKANLGSSIVMVDGIRSMDGAAFSVRRAFGQSPSVFAQDGRLITSVDLDRGTFLPIDVFTAQRIEDIAQEAVGGKRRQLLDDLRTEQLYEINGILSEYRRSLEANADQIRDALRRITDLAERIEEIGDARANLAAAPPLAANDIASKQLSEETSQHQANEREANRVKTILEISARMRSGVVDVVAGVTGMHRGIPPSGRNRELILKIEDVFDTAAKDFVIALEQASAALLEADNRVRGFAQQLRDAHSAQQSNYVRLQEQNQAASKAVRVRAELESSVAALDQLEKERVEMRRQLDEFRKKRADIKAKYLLQRDRISALRESIANDLQREAGSKVRIRIFRNADNLQYEQTLGEALRGARLRNHEEILKCLTALRPEDLAQILVENDCAELTAQTNLGAERCKKILDAFRAALDPLSLEVLPTEDRVAIELNVGTDSNPNFKDAAELSAGQKCTALLPILLARRDSPLVIDQPEDNLDNHFIYETVVESIRRLKTKRQMIFITHNANIPVLAEAELIIVLNSDGKTGFVEKRGTLDECREEIIDLLEGGKEAFERRRERYAR